MKENILHTQLKRDQLPETIRTKTDKELRKIKINKERTTILQHTVCM